MLFMVLYGADRRLMDFSWCFNEKYNVAFARFGTVPVSADVDCPYSRKGAVAAKARKNAINSLPVHVKYLAELFLYTIR